MECYEIIGNYDGLSFKKEQRDVKGKGLMQTFIVNANKEFDDEDYFKRRISSGVNALYGYSKNSEIECLEIEECSNDRKSSKCLCKTSSKIERKMSNKEKIHSFWNIFSTEFHSSNKFYAKSMHAMAKIGMIITLISNFVFIILSLVRLTDDNDKSHGFKLGYFLFEEIVLIIWLIFLKKIHKKMWHGYALAIIYSLQVIVFFIETATIGTVNTVEVLFLYSRFILTTYYTGLIFSRSLLVTIFFTIFWLTKVTIFNFIAHILWFSLFFLIITFCASIRLEYRLKMYQKLKEAGSKELEKTEQLLTQMIPFHVLQDLQQETSVTDLLKQVTVMYADIVGFTAWSSEKSSIEVVEMLSELFTRFDKTCLDHDVYKVHTIGDCYVAMGYRGDIQRNPAKEASNMVNFALALIDLIEEVNEKCECKLKMRIGLHTGDVIGGITGTNIVRYDIYGQDVMLANKMESNGVPGRVAVSEKTKKLLEGYENDHAKFDFEFLKEVKNGKEVIKLSLLSKIIR
ncbi:hypothetical protein SteCoe_34205 [Stentor coeruleus]|uniref:adenylate cyclase n=1 Tax=Stentor coeruleus TaxID=5963 RepID=A0A1R2AVF7_9CILI|nr:hypothetical protein SteCoe_34205 [Stentor coeruleus]